MLIDVREGHALHMEERDGKDVFYIAETVSANNHAREHVRKLTPECYTLKELAKEFEKKKPRVSKKYQMRDWILSFED